MRTISPEANPASKSESRGSNRPDTQGTGENAFPASKTFQDSILSLQRTIGNRAVQRLLQRSPAPRPAVALPQFNPVPTWGGTFTSTYFAPEADKPNLIIKFDPDRKVVNAEKIAMVQTARSLEDDPNQTMKQDPDPKAQPGMVVPKEPEDAIQRPDFHATAEFRAKARQVFDSRMLTGDPNSTGTHIDAPPENRTPVLGMQDPKPGDNSLGGSQGGGLDKFGHCTPKMGCAPAQMWDAPSMSTTAAVRASQEFETSAVAVEGAQKGTYYGSVKWGWKKEVGGNVEAIPFALAKNAAPSETFSEAADQWNRSSDMYGEKSIPLPPASDQFVNKRSELQDDNNKTLVLEPGTPVETGEQNKDRVKVTVTGGRAKGQTGWLSAGALSDRESGSRKPR